MVFAEPEGPSSSGPDVEYWRGRHLVCSSEETPRGVHRPREKTVSLAEDWTVSLAETDEQALPGGDKKKHLAVLAVPSGSAKF